MRVAYGDSNVLRCNIQLAYDRFQTSFNYPDVQRRAISTADGVVTSKDIRYDVEKLTNSQRDNRAGTIVNDNKGGESYIFDSTTQTAIDELGQK